MILFPGDQATVEGDLHTVYPIVLGCISLLAVPITQAIMSI